MGFQKPLLLRYGLCNGMEFLRSVATMGRSMYEQEATNRMLLPPRLLGCAGNVSIIVSEAQAWKGGCH